MVAPFVSCQQAVLYLGDLHSLPEECHNPEKFRYKPLLIRNLVSKHQRFLECLPTLVRHLSILAFSQSPLPTLDILTPFLKTIKPLVDPT